MGRRLENIIYRNLKGCDYMRIYISGAITKDKNYFNHFERVENELKKLGFSCINPAKVNSNMPDDFTNTDMHLLKDILFYLKR